MRERITLGALVGAAIAVFGLTSQASAQISPLILVTNNAKASCTDFNFASSSLKASPLKGGTEIFEATFANPLIPGDNVAIKVELMETKEQNKVTEIRWESLAVADPDTPMGEDPILSRYLIPALVMKGGTSAVHIYSLGPGSGATSGIVSDSSGINELEFCVFEPTATLAECPPSIEFAMRDLALANPNEEDPANWIVDNPAFLGIWAVLQNVSSAFGAPDKNDDTSGPALCLGAGLEPPRPCINQGGVENACGKNLGAEEAYNNQSSTSVSRHGEDSTNIWCTTGANGRELCFDLTTGQLIN